MRLLRAGDAPVLAISDAGQPCPISATNAVTRFSPDPDTTHGEARFIRTMVRLRHLHSVIVVAGRPQATRARVRIERCFTGRIKILGVDPPSPEQWVYQIAYERGCDHQGATIQRGC